MDLSAFPVVVERVGDDWLAHTIGETPSTHLLSWVRERPVPTGFRWAPGSQPIETLDPSERSVGVDQTNHSVIVGDRVVVKWITVPLAGPHPAPERIRRLVDAGFTQLPAVWGTLEWRTPDGDWVPVATTVELVPDATDGWTWCLHEARVALGIEHGPAIPFAGELGALTADMHLALADPPEGPVATHGDFHVGQILRDPAGRLYVLDFDGNPTLTPEERVAHRPAAYDVAGMLLSLENIGYVVRKYNPEVPEQTVADWTTAVQQEFLAAYRVRAGRLLDESLLGAYVDDQIQRELDYAQAHLPEWRYVPEAALRRRGRL